MSRTTLTSANTRDAADAAFLSTYGGRFTLPSQEIGAPVDGADLPIEDRAELVAVR